MSRPLRIIYPGAYYHVVNHGNHRQDIFETNDDRITFLNILGRVVDPFCTVFLCVALLWGCSSLTTTQKLEKAEAILASEGQDAFQRAIAYGLYMEVLETSKDQDQLVRAHFGAGMIGFLDLVHAIPKVVRDLSAGDGNSEGGSTLPPAAELVPVIYESIHQLVGVGVVDHFEFVINQDDFSFMFDRGVGDDSGLVFPSVDPKSINQIDFQGEWDLTEIRIVYGLGRLVLGLVDSIYAYDLVIDTVIEVAFSGADFPPLPEDPTRFFDWFKDVALAAGLTQLPWLNPEFGVYSADADINQIRGHYVSAFETIADGFVYLSDETDAQDDDVFDKDSFVSDVIKKLSLVPSIGLLAPVLDGLVTPVDLHGLFRSLESSAVSNDIPFVLPDFLDELLDFALAFISAGDPMPTATECIGLPAFKIGKLLGDPIRDLKDLRTGIFPMYNDTGYFVVESEREPWADDGDDVVEDGEYTDSGIDGFIDADHDGVPDDPAAPRLGAGNGRYDEHIALRADDVCQNTELDVAVLEPLAHIDPNGDVELPNGIVDTIYFYVPNADLNDSLERLIRNGDGELESSGETMTNADLMRFVSHIAWIVDQLN